MTTDRPFSAVSNQPIAATLARFVAELRLDHVPTAVVARAKLCLLDFMGVTLAAAREAPARAIVDFVRAFGGVPEATVWGCASTAPAALAALANGSVGHHLELDDGHIVGHVHPGATVIPAAFALAERRAASGRDLLTAIIAGYEVLIRTGRAMAASAMYDRGYHGPGLFGAFGAAAAAAAVLRLDEAQATRAVGNCCLAPAATFQTFTEGANVKDLYCGWPAMVGTMAAQLAAGGIGGPRQLFEGKLGFARAVADRSDLAGMTADLGRIWLLPTAYVKRHSACSFAHTMIDAVLSLASGGPIPLEAVEHMTVRTHRFAADLDEPSPQTLTAAKSSLPFCAALALTRGHALLTDFTEDVLADDRVRWLASRTTIVMDPALDAQHAAREDRRPVRVEVALADGRRLTAERDVARGWAEDPLDPQDIAGKFQALTEPAYGPGVVRRLLDTLASLEDLEDVRVLGRALAAASSA